MSGCSIMIFGALEAFAGLSGHNTVTAREQSRAAAFLGKKNWRIEYEIPPLRAIYYAEADDYTESELREALALHQPMWRIRKLT